MYLSGLSNFVQVLVPILKIYLRLIPEKLVELSNLIKMQTIYQIWSKCKQVGSSYAKIYSLAPARVQLNYCYTRECQGTKQFRRVISHSRVLMQGLFIPLGLSCSSAGHVCSVPVPVRTVCQVYFCVIMYGLFISDAFYDFVLAKPKQWAAWEHWNTEAAWQQVFTNTKRLKPKGPFQRQKWCTLP